MFLDHIDLVEGLHVCKTRDVPAIAHTGPRGGIRIPRRVVWKPLGSGLFMMTRKGPDGQSRPSLYPFVEYTNGKSDRPRLEPLDKWLDYISK